MNIDFFTHLFLVPAVDSITYHIRKMRQKIGLVVELPRHGPGVKEEMIEIEERLLEPSRVKRTMLSFVFSFLLLFFIVFFCNVVVSIYMLMCMFVHE